MLYKGTKNVQGYFNLISIWVSFQNQVTAAVDYFKFYKLWLVKMLTPCIVKNIKFVIKLNFVVSGTNNVSIRGQEGKCPTKVIWLYAMLHLEIFCDWTTWACSKLWSMTDGLQVLWELYLPYTCVVSRLYAASYAPPAYTALWMVSRLENTSPTGRQTTSCLRECGHCWCAANKTILLLYLLSLLKETNS